MEICPLLFGALNLEPHALQPCCDVHGCEVPSFPFSGGEVDMRSYAAHIENCFRRLQHKEDPLCRSCQKRISLPDGALKELDLQFKTISINSHRYLCNCKCVYCELWKHRDRGEGYRILPVLESLSAQGALAPDCLISWGGGEPSILKDFEAASLWATGNGYWQKVHTNALRFSPAIAQLLREQQGEINISLDSGSLEIYEKVKGVDGFSTVLKNLGRYVEEAADIQTITLKYIIFEANNRIPEITRFFDLVTGLGIRRVLYSMDFREVNDKGPTEKSLLAAAFFTSKAQELGLECTPFFIPPKYLKDIARLRKRYFPGPQVTARKSPAGH